MGPSSDQLERQIAEVRGSMESSIVELRDRSRRQVRVATRAALIALGIGAAVGVVIVGVIVVTRFTRQPTTRERLRRLIPPGAFGIGRDLRHARRSLELRARRRIPNMRLYIGDRQVGEEPPATAWERIAVRAAQAAGTAAAGALASRLLAGLTQRRPRS